MRPFTEAPVRNPMFPSMKGVNFILSASSSWVSWLSELVAAVRHADQVSGTVTFVTSNSATVTFADPQPDTSYFLTLGGNADERFYWTTKTTTGFTARSSNAGSTAILNWVLTR